MPLRIDYALTGLGWAECTLSDGPLTTKITASYLSDALGNLVLAGCAAASGFTAFSFSFEEEPGEYRWVLRSSRLNEYELEILDLPALGSLESKGQRVFHTTCLPETFANAVRDAANSVLAELGEAGYAEKWDRFPFPNGPIPGAAAPARSEYVKLKTSLQQSALGRGCVKTCAALPILWLAQKSTSQIGLQRAISMRAMVEVPPEKSRFNVFTQPRPKADVVSETV